MTLILFARPLLVATVIAGLAACGASSAGLVGASERPPGGSIPPLTRDAGPVQGAASLPENYRTKFAKVNKARMASAGHATGRWDIDIYANETASIALAARAREVPVGAIVVQEHFEKDGARGPIMVMEKRAKGYASDNGDWRWTVVGSSGQLVSDGIVASCAGCHNDAPMDGMFPISDSP